MSEQESDLQDVVNELRRFQPWAEFRDRVIEFRVKALQVNALKPCSTQEQFYDAERAKGAIIALLGLLDLFDRKLPTKKDADDAA